MRSKKWVRWGPGSPGEGQYLGKSTSPLQSVENIHSEVNILKPIQQVAAEIRPLAGSTAATRYNNKITWYSLVWTPLNGWHGSTLPINLLDFIQCLFTEYTQVTRYPNSIQLTTKFKKKQVCSDTMYADNMALPAFASCCCRNQLISPAAAGPQQQTHSSRVQQPDGTDGRMDSCHKPCSAYYVGSVNKNKS